MLLTVPRAPWLRLVIAGQTVPDRAKVAWARYAAPIVRLRQPKWQDWLEFAKRHREDVTPEDVQTAYRLSRGRPSLLAQLLGSSA